MVTKDYKEKEEKQEKNESKKECPLQIAINNNKRRIEEFKQHQIDEDKKKGVTNQENKYLTFLEVAVSLGIIILFGLMLAITFVPDFSDVIVAFIESLDPFKKIKGGQPLAPSDYVMFLKYNQWQLF